MSTLHVVQCLARTGQDLSCGNAAMARFGSLNQNTYIHMNIQIYMYLVGVGFKCQLNVKLDFLIVVHVHMVYI